MGELAALLNQVEDSYFDFISAMLHYAQKTESRQTLLIDYLKNHPEAKSSDVIRFVSDQPDFYEDAAYMQTA